MDGKVPAVFAHRSVCICATLEMFSLLLFSWNSDYFFILFKPERRLPQISSDVWMIFLEALCCVFSLRGLEMMIGGARL